MLVRHQRRRVRSCEDGISDNGGVQARGEARRGEEVQGGEVVVSGDAVRDAVGDACAVLVHVRSVRCAREGVCVVPIPCLEAGWAERLGWSRVPGS